jgi:simple sugar transport system ATP-binding protein
MTRTPILELDRVSKRFLGVEALSAVSLQVHSGEVLCLLGDNGAGKSTLIKIMSGVHRQSAGTIRVGGEEVRFSGPHDANELGIATVHQTGGTVPLMSVARNFFLGAEPTRGPWPLRRIDKKRAASIAIEQLQALGITRIDDGSRLVGSMSGGERQALSIARAMYFGARLLILDEPTASLGVKEAAHVLRMIAQARSNGVGVVFVTHNANHAMAVGDHFGVLIRGSLADDFRRGERTRHELIDLMAGGEEMDRLAEELAEQTSTDGTLVAEERWR